MRVSFPVPAAPVTIVTGRCRSEVGSERLLIRATSWCETVTMTYMESAKETFYWPRDAGIHSPPIITAATGLWPAR